VYQCVAGVAEGIKTGSARGTLTRAVKRRGFCTAVAGGINAINHLYLVDGVVPSVVKAVKDTLRKAEFTENNEEKINSLVGHMHQLHHFLRRLRQFSANGCSRGIGPC
jgi:hypothetical protein